MKYKLETILTITTTLITFVSWAFGDVFSSWDKEYYIPVKTFIVFLVFTTCALISLGVYILFLKRKINDLTRLAPLEDYDVLCDSKGNKYCPYHKTIVTHTGPNIRAEDSFWCPTCRSWFEKKSNQSQSSIYPFHI
jgi:hypothetical protein